MKKLLILATIIVAGVAANAASFQWTAANFYGSDGTKFTGTADIYAYASTKTLADAVLVTSAAITSGAINKTLDWTDATVGTTYNFYMVVTDGDKTFNSSISDPTVIKSGAAVETGTTKVLFANMTAATLTNASSNWQSVPEPTSGLLMLLGMAGLALKRKRA